MEYLELMNTKVGHIELFGKVYELDKAFLCLLLDAMCELDYDKMYIPPCQGAEYPELMKGTQNRLRKFLQTISQEDIKNYDK